MSIVRNVNLQQAVAKDDVNTVFQYLDGTTSLALDSANLLIFAARNQRHSVLALLAANYNEFDLCSRIDKSIQPIHFEAAAGNSEAACNLAKNSSLFWCRTSGYTAIELAAEAGQLETVSDLLREEAFTAHPPKEQLAVLKSVYDKISLFEVGEQPEGLLFVFLEIQFCLLSLATKGENTYPQLTQIAKQIAAIANEKAQPLTNPLTLQSHAKTLHPAHPSSITDRKTPPLSRNSLFSSQEDSEEVEPLAQKLAQMCMEWNLTLKPIPNTSLNLFEALVDQFKFLSIYPKHTASSLQTLSTQHYTKYAARYGTHALSTTEKRLMQGEGEIPCSYMRTLIMIARELQLRLVVVKEDSDGLPICFTPRAPKATICLGFEKYGAQYHSLRYETLNPVIESLFEAVELDRFEFQDSQTDASAEMAFSPENQADDAMEINRIRPSASLR